MIPKAHLSTLVRRKIGAMVESLMILQKSSKKENLLLIQLVDRIFTSDKALAVMD
jgi:hypothetical protein